MTSAMKTVGWTHVHTVEIAIMKEPISLVPSVNPAIIPSSDGIVEQKGWLPLGGYRIGIRSDSGGYFYYAHLSSYEEDFTPGDRVQAGEILGFMGNTGYGQEGTSERFPVHLHLGIYITTPEGQDISVNPYHVLQCLRKKIRKYTYY